MKIIHSYNDNRKEIMTDSNDLTPEAKALIDTIIEKQEGGWKLTENPNDPDGGWTYAGVTATVYSKYIKKLGASAGSLNYEDIEARIADVPEENKADIYQIYCQNYYLPLHLSELPASIRGPLFSCAVNCGTETAVSILQSAYNSIQHPGAHLNVDGVLGDITLMCVRNIYGGIDVANMYMRNSFLKQWMLHYINLVQENASAWESAARRLNFPNTQDKLLGVKLPSVNRAASLEGWFNRIEFWR